MVFTRALVLVALAGSALTKDTCCADQDSCIGHATCSDEVVMLQQGNSAGLKRAVQQQSDVAMRVESEDETTNAIRQMLPEDEYGAIGGRCLDGGMAGYYYGAPSSGLSSTSTWVIWIDGGGACFDETSCLAWQQGGPYNRPASRPWPATRQGTSKIVSDDSSINPHFHDAHHVQVPYCTGDLHAGQNQEPTTLGDTDFYFSGHLNFKHILQHIMDNYRAEASNMERVLLVGSSAGGAGVINNCDFLQTFLAEAGSPAQVSCAPAAGWFNPGFTEDHPDDEESKPSLYNDWRANPAVATDWTIHTKALNEMLMSHQPKECVAALGSEEAWKCGSATVVYPYIEAPMFVMQNWFDNVQLNAESGLPYRLFDTSSGRDYIGYFGRAMQISAELVNTIPKPGNGLFLASCLDHGDGIGSTRGSAFETTINGHTSAESLADWFYGHGLIPAVLIDDCDPGSSDPRHGLPCNPSCMNWDAYVACGENNPQSC